MSKTKNNIFGIARNESQTVDILEGLRAAGISDGRISLLLPANLENRECIEKHTKAPEAAVTGVSTGGVVGGLLGFLAATGTLAIPGVGIIVAAGPIMAALSGAAVGATVGGMAGALVGLGIPEYEAKRFERRMKKGSILISVEAENDIQKKTVNSIFQEFEAQDVSFSEITA